MTVQVTGDDPESCDRCGSRGCVLRPIQLDSGDVQLVCWDCYHDLDADRRVARINWRSPPTESSSRIELEEFDPAGSSFGLVDPERPRERFLHAENALELGDWR